MVLLPAQGAAQQAKKLKIGGLICLTGWFSSMDIQMGNELLLVQDMINERGGLNIKGQKYEIELDIEDCKSSLDGVTAAATSMASKGIKFAVGPAAFFARASAPITNQNQMLDVLGYCTNTPEEIGPNQPYTFLGFAGSVGRVYSGAKFLKQKFPKVKNLCMVSPAGGINKYLEAIMRNHLTSLGYNIVGEWVVFADDTTDWNPLAAKINANKKADIVFWVNCISFHAGNMVKSLREIGYDKWVLALSNVPGPDLMKITGKEAATKVITQAFTPNAPGNKPDLDKLISMSRAKYGNDIPLYMETANPLYVLAEVIKKAQSIDPTEVKKAWEAMDGQKIPGLFGDATICGTKTYGIKGHGISHPFPMTQIDKGKVSDLGWVDYGTIP
jgi:branched-chain amino acid transport system substrate-binding protein